MRPQILFLLIFMFLLDCKIKSPKIVEVTDIDPNEELYYEYIKDKQFIEGEIVFEQKSWTSAVIKIIIDENHCIGCYANNGKFSFYLNVSQVQESSSIMFVYQEYSIKTMLLKDFLKSSKKIILEKKDDLISEEIYWNFFHQIPICNREMLKDFKNRIKNER